MNLILASYAGIGFLFGVFFTLVGVVTVMEHYERMEVEDDAV